MSPVKRMGRGRPPKFGRRARPVTMTLPVDVITRLGAVDADLGRAVVSIVSGLIPARSGMRPPVEQAVHGRHAVIIVAPVPALRQLRGVELVPVGDGRALIALDPTHSIARFELDLRDALERGQLTRGERDAFVDIASILQEARQSRRVALQERTIIVLESSRRTRPTA